MFLCQVLYRYLLPCVCSCSSARFLCRRGVHFGCISRPRSGSSVFMLASFWANSPSCARQEPSAHVGVPCWCLTLSMLRTCVPGGVSLPGFAILLPSQSRAELPLLLDLGACFRATVPWTLFMFIIVFFSFSSFSCSFSFSFSVACCHHEYLAAWQGVDTTRRSEHLTCAHGKERRNAPKKAFFQWLPRLPKYVVHAYQVRQSLILEVCCFEVFLALNSGHRT